MLLFTSCVMYCAVKGNSILCSVNKISKCEPNAIQSIYLITNIYLFNYFGLINLVIMLNSKESVKCDDIRVLRVLIFNILVSCCCLVRNNRFYILYIELILLLYHLVCRYVYNSVWEVYQRH